jgi:hypothetical protein
VRGAQLMVELRHISWAHGEKKKARFAGCGNYVPKPFSPGQILAKIYAIPVPSLALIAAVSLSWHKADIPTPATNVRFRG